MRLIDADELRKHAFWECYDNPDYDYQYVTIDQINYAPTIDAEPIRHGRWIDVNDYHIGTCSICGSRWGSVDVMRYCPYCGSRMDEATP